MSYDLSKLGRGYMSLTERSKKFSLPRGRFVPELAARSRRSPPAPSLGRCRVVRQTRDLETGQTELGRPSRGLPDRSPKYGTDLHMNEQLEVLWFGVTGGINTSIYGRYYYSTSRKTKLVMIQDWMDCWMTLVRYVSLRAISSLWVPCSTH